MCIVLSRKLYYINLTHHIVDDKQSELSHPEYFMVHNGFDKPLIDVQQIIPSLFSVSEAGSLSSSMMIKPTRMILSHTNDNLDDNSQALDLKVYTVSKADSRPSENDTNRKTWNTANVSHWNEANDDASKTNVIHTTDAKDHHNDEKMFAMAMASYNKV